MLYSFLIVIANTSFTIVFVFVSLGLKDYYVPFQWVSKWIVCKFMCSSCHFLPVSPVQLSILSFPISLCNLHLGMCLGYKLGFFKNMHLQSIEAFNPSDVL
jgi:hypothetical protein